MAKQPEVLQWVEDFLPSEFFRKPMFGGFAYYVDQRLVLATFESEGDHSYRGQIFEFEIWNGCLFPTEREHHLEIKARFPFLISHPVLSKWLYLPVQVENFESHVELILKEIRRKSPLFGVVPKQKKGKAPSATGRGGDRSLSRVDLRKPKMFSDEPSIERLAKAKKISDLKNLGPATEAHFKKAGIQSVDQFVKLGWKKALSKLVEANKKNLHTMFAYALIGALTNKEWHRLSPEEKAEAKAWVKTLKAR